MLRSKSVEKAELIVLEEMRKAERGN